MPKKGKNNIAKEHEIRDFYSSIKFPGEYTIADLEYYDSIITNRYLKFYDNCISNNKTVIDVGCGSGFIVNFLARRHPNVQFTAVDFSNSIDFAKQFSDNHNIKNIVYHKADFVSWESGMQYDMVFCNGVLHHIPSWKYALKKIQEMSRKQMVLGIYNTYGKYVKKFFTVNYRHSEVLYKDQEACPFEVSFDDREFRELFSECYRLESVMPSLNNKIVNIMNLFNYNNGGLTIYSYKHK